MTDPDRPSTLWLRASTLHDLARCVLPLAGTDDYLPVLAAVRLQVRAGHLTAVATDRMRIGMYRTQLLADDAAEERATQPATWSALLSTRDLRRALQVFRPNRLEDQLLALTTEHGEIAVTAAGARYSYVDASLRFRQVDGLYPVVDQIFTGLLDGKPLIDERVALDPAFLADFRHARLTATEPLLVWRVDGQKMIAVSCGDHFLGALMPIRSGDRDRPDLLDVDGWRSVLTTPPGRVQSTPAAQAREVVNA